MTRQSLTVCVTLAAVLLLTGTVHAGALEQAAMNFDVQKFVENTAPPTLALIIVGGIVYKALQNGGKTAERIHELTAQLIRDNAVREARRDAEIQADKAAGTQRELRNQEMLKAQQDVTIHTLPALARTVREATETSRKIVVQRDAEIKVQAAQAKAAQEQNELMATAVREIRQVADQLRLWRQDDLEERRSARKTGPLPGDAAADGG